MRKDGVITIFLSLILLIFMNFVMTVIEAAGITAGRSYIELLTTNAGNAETARYYYPLFQQYGLLAVDEGMGESSFDYADVEKRLTESLEFAAENTIGGLLNFSDCQVEAVTLTTLTGNNYKDFTNQIKEQAIYEGAELLSSFLTDNSIDTVGKVAKLQVKQQEAAESVSQVSIEILKLMQLVDGICTTGNGLKTDRKGHYQVAENFVKKIRGSDSTALEASYGSSVVFESVKGDFFDLDKTVNALLTAMADYEKLRRLDKEGYEALIKRLYETLRDTMGGTSNAIVSAIAQAELLGKMQKLSQSGVLRYEQELLGMTGLEESVLLGLQKELNALKDYVGLNEGGYNAEAIKKTLFLDLGVLQTAALPDFLEMLDENGHIDREKTENTLVASVNALSAFSLEHLRFDYGDLQAADSTIEMLTSGLNKLFSGSFLELLGVKDVSEKAISGIALPSRGRDVAETTGIVPLFRSMSEMLSEGNIGALLKKGYDSISDDFLMEVYLSNHFSGYGEATDNSTKIDYEREYILHGHKKDSENLVAMAMELIALRSAFCFAMLIADAERNSKATAMAKTMAVFGVPALCYAAKYLILTVWAVEEAIVEVSALLAGKRLPAFNPQGNVKAHELLLMTSDMVKAKVDAVSSTTAGIGYKDYLMVLSFLQNDSLKKGRALDLIQENIRYRYRDAFRIGNCITGGTVNAKAVLIKKIQTGFFTEKTGDIQVQCKFGY